MEEVHNSARGYGKLSRGRSTLCVLREPERDRRGTILGRTLMYRRDEGGRTTAEVLVRTGKKAVVRLGDIARRGQLPRSAPTSSAFACTGEGIVFRVFSVPRF